MCTVLTCGRFVRPAGTLDLLGCVHCMYLWAICPAGWYFGSLGLGALYVLVGDLSGRLVLWISWAGCTVCSCGRFVRPAGTLDLLGCVHCTGRRARCRGLSRRLTLGGFYISGHVRHSCCGRAGRPRAERELHATNHSRGWRRPDQQKGPQTLVLLLFIISIKISPSSVLFHKKTAKRLVRGSVLTSYSTFRPRPPWS